MKLGKPEPGDVIAMRDALKGSDSFGLVRNSFEVDEQFYELNFQSELQLPKEFASEGIVLPTARDMVDTAVDHTDISNVRIYANKHSETNVSNEAAEALRKFCIGVLYRNNTEATISPFRIAAKHFWLHGVTHIKTIWDADKWPDKPIQKKNENDDAYRNRLNEWQGESELAIPIQITAVNPRNIMPDPDHFKPEFYIEEHERTVFTVMKHFPKWSNPNKRKLEENVKWTEWWDDEYKIFLADDEPVLRVRGGVDRHGYGFLPYTTIDSGLGNQSYEGRLEMRWVGLLRYMLDALRSESRGYSIHDIVLKQEAWPWGYLTGTPDALGAISEIKTKYGRFEKWPDGVKLEQVRPQVPPQALLDHYRLTADIIASHAAPRSVRGLSEQGVRSGADRRLMIAEAGARYSYSRDAFKYGTARVLINCARLFKNVIPGDVRVWAKTPNDEFDAVIKKDDLKEPFSLTVEYAPISEEDEYRRHDDLERMLQTGLITLPWARRQMSNVDPEAMAKEDEKEKIKNSPAMQEAMNTYIKLAAAEEFGTRAEAEIGGVAGGAIGAPQQPTGGMTTGIPNVASLGSPQNLQNQLAQNRSPQSIRPLGQGIGGGGART